MTSVENYNPDVEEFIRKRPRLCCIVLQDYRCTACSYSCCTSCKNILVMFTSNLRLGKNSLYDDHYHWSRDCKTEHVTEPL